MCRIVIFLFGMFFVSNLLARTTLSDSTFFFVLYAKSYKKNPSESTLASLELSARNLRTYKDSRIYFVPLTIWGAIDSLYDVKDNDKTRNARRIELMTKMTKWMYKTYLKLPKKK